MQTGDIRLIKNINERLVLNLIREHKLISGAELANLTGMRPSTISSLLKELQKKSLVINQGKGESTIKGGKRPFLWSLNKDVGYTIGIDLEINQAIGVMLDLDTNVIHRKIYKDQVIKKPEDLAELTSSVVGDLLKEQKKTLKSLLGMGVGISGIVNVEKGIIITSDVLPQTEIPLGEMLKTYYNFPIFIENNANAAAMAAKWAEKSKGANNYMTALVEFDNQVGGLGVGLVLREELFHGASYSAGELNFSLPTLDSELQALRHRFSEGKVLSKYSDSWEKVDIHILMEAAQNGDAVAIGFFERLGRTIGRGLARTVAMINPEMLIIDGDIAVLEDLITIPIKSAIEEEVHPLTNSSLKIETGAYGRYAVSIGAASIVLNDIFKKPLVTSNSIKNYF